MSATSTTWWDLKIPSDLKKFAGRFRATTCALWADTPSDWVNVLTMIVAEESKKLRGTKFLTSHPISIDDGRLNLGIVQLDLSVEDVEAILRVPDYLPLPGSQGAGRLDKSGHWLTPRFYGRADSGRPSWLPPPSVGPLWVMERWGLLQNNTLSESARTKLSKSMEEVLEVPIPSARWGNVLLCVPDGRYWTCAEALQGPGASVEIVSMRNHESQTEGEPPRFAVVLRSRREQVTEYSHHRVVEIGSHAFPYAEDVPELDIEIFDLSSGFPVDRHSLPLLRGFRTTLSLQASSRISAQASFLAKPKTAEFRFEDKITSEVNMRKSWEDELKKEHTISQLNYLKTSGQLRIYEGSLYGRQEEQRRSAVTDLRDEIAAGVSRVWIWDTYFGAEDAVEFLSAVRNRRAEVRVLRSRKGGANAREEESRINSAAKFLRKLPDGTVGLLNLEFRGSGRTFFHDRFLIVDDRCLLLGASFNQIGKTVSTVIFIPDLEIVTRMFGVAWSNATLIA